MGLKTPGFWNSDTCKWYFEIPASLLMITGRDSCWPHAHGYTNITVVYSLIHNWGTYQISVRNEWKWSHILFVPSEVISSTFIPSGIFSGPVGLMSLFICWWFSGLYLQTRVSPQSSFFRARHGCLVGISNQMCLNGLPVFPSTPVQPTRLAHLTKWGSMLLVVGAKEPGVSLSPLFLFAHPTSQQVLSATLENLSPPHLASYHLQG